MDGRLAGDRRTLPAGGEVLAPYRLLASRVIALAIRDLMTHEQAASEHHSARAFLSGSGMLTHWCELAGIDPAIVRARVNGFAEHGRLLSVRGPGD